MQTKAENQDLALIERQERRIAALEAAVLGAVHLLRDGHEDAAAELLEQTYHGVGKQD